MLIVYNQEGEDHIQIHQGPKVLQIKYLHKNLAQVVVKQNNKVSRKFRLKRNYKYFTKLKINGLTNHLLKFKS